MEDYDCIGPDSATESNSCGFYGLYVQNISDEEFTVQTELGEISIMHDGTGRAFQALIELSPTSGSTDTTNIQ